MKLILSNGGTRRSFDALTHHQGDELVVELESTNPQDSLTFQDFSTLVQQSVTNVWSTDSPEDLFATATEEVRRFTAYDRVMVYRFRDNWDGEVVGEARGDSVDSYLGLRFPGSDIPAQARRLCENQHLRLIADVSSEPLKLIDEPTVMLQGPLNITHCILRAVSPVHLEYLQNMGVCATLSISLVNNGKLQGLIACHHQTPRMVSFERRLSCEFLGQTLASHWATLKDRKSFEYRIRSTTLQEELANQVNGFAEFGLNDVRTGYPRVTDLVDCTGAAVITGANCVRLGETPSEPMIRKIVDLFVKHREGPVAETNSLQRDFPDLETIDCRIACGVLFAEVSRERSEYLLWFRPEVIQAVHWAGKPEKLLSISEDGVPRLHPRRSFQLWQEEVQGQSAPWTVLELEATIRLRDFAARRGEQRGTQARARQQSALAKLGHFVLAEVHPDRGIISPTRFIPIAEESGQIRAIDRWVLDTRVVQLRQWELQGRDLELSLNVSARSLQDPTFGDWVSQKLAATQVDPKRMVLELTESAMMKEHERSFETLDKLAKLGVSIAVDVFGTGYPSLSYLMKLPVHKVKIDRSLVATMVSNHGCEMIAKLVTELAHNLQSMVIAKGVEDVEMLERLAALECDIAQGYLFGKPLFINDLERTIDAKHGAGVTYCLEHHAPTSAPQRFSTNHGDPNQYNQL